MSDNNPIFQGNIEDLDTLEIDQNLASARHPYVLCFSDGILKARKYADENGDSSAVTAYQLLYELVSFSPDFSDSAKPYRARFLMEGKRSMIPDDLAEEDYIVVRKLLERTQSASLKARLSDLLWIKEKKHLDCIAAVNSYIESAKGLEMLSDEFSWFYAKDEYNRALQLASLLGPRSASYKNASDAIFEAIERSVDRDIKEQPYHYMEIAREHRVGDPVVFAEKAHKFGSQLKSENDHFWSKNYFELEAEFWRFAQQADKQQLAQIEVGESYVSKAVDCLSTGQGHFAAATHLKDGIEALRRAKANPNRISELRKLLSEYQEKIPGEMTGIDHSYDITEEVKKCREFVTGLSFEQALTKFVAGIPLVNLDELKKLVQEIIEKSPLVHAIGSSLLDHKGKSRAEKKSILELTGDEAEKALEGKMVYQFCNFRMPHVTSCFIKPAREQIVNEHQPDLYDLIPLVRNNPFIPEHHEGIFLRGLHAGFHGDFLLASSLLVPQIENSIRHVLESHGVETSNLLEDGTQPYKLLGPLFDIPETKEIFSEPLCFELRSLLIDKEGPEFRNRIAHGFATEAECFSDAAIYLWWVVLGICHNPFINSVH